MPRDGLSTPNLSGLSGAPLVVGLTRHELVHPAGLPPANSPFEAEDDYNFTTDAKWLAEPKLGERRWSSPPTLHRGSLRRPRDGRRKLESRAGIAPAFAVLQTAA